MKNGIQSIFLTLGEEACFFLQILKIAESYLDIDLDPFTVAVICSKKGYIYLNLSNLKDKDNFLVSRYADILKLLTGKDWVYEKKEATYKSKKNEYVINEYKNGSYKHFDSDDFHSLQDSQTVKNGKIISKRVFRVKE